MKPSELETRGESSRSKCGSLLKCLARIEELQKMRTELPWWAWVRRRNTDARIEFQTYARDYYRDRDLQIEAIPGACL